MTAGITISKHRNRLKADVIVLVEDFTADIAIALSIDYMTSAPWTFDDIKDFKVLQGVIKNRIGSYCVRSCKILLLLTIGSLSTTESIGGLPH